ncbi:MAG: hypothetical protein AAF423_03780 [Pseudomonadota bacterium]
MRTIISCLTLICFLSAAVLADISSSLANGLVSEQSIQANAKISIEVATSVTSSSVLAAVDVEDSNTDHCKCDNDTKNVASFSCGIVLALSASPVEFDSLAATKCGYNWAHSFGLDLFPDPIKRPPRIIL